VNDGSVRKLKDSLPFNNSESSSEEDNDDDKDDGYQKREVVTNDGQTDLVEERSVGGVGSKEVLSKTDGKKSTGKGPNGRKEDEVKLEQSDLWKEKKKQIRTLCDRVIDVVAYKTVMEKSHNSGLPLMDVSSPKT
jgi:hypothetical protein